MNISNTTKKIEITELQSVKDEFTSDSINYKKLTLNQLRLIASDKNIVEDPTKLKKNELIKLLENN